MTEDETRAARASTGAAGFSRRSDAARQVADLIRSDIRAGALRGALPLEFQLMSRYGSTRNALRDALSLLSNQGLVMRTPGTGTFAVASTVFLAMERTTRSITIHDEPGGEPASVLVDTDTPPADHRAVTSRVLTTQLRTAPECVSRNLELEPGSEVVFMDSLISVDGSPIRLRTSWIPAEVGRPLLAADLPGYVPSRIEAQVRQPIHAARLLIEAVNADPWSAALLGTSEGAALLLCERVLVTPEGVPVEFGFSRHRGDRSVLDSRVRPTG